MTYQRQSEVPKKRPEQEIRVEKLLTELSILYKVNMLFCAACRAIGPNLNGSHYPSYCPNCFASFDGPGQYSLPDFVIDKAGILYVNGSIHDKARNIRKDREQIKALKDAGHAVFVLNNDEIDNMHDSTLKAALLGFYDAIFDTAKYERIYKGEKEIACLR